MVILAALLGANAAAGESHPTASGVLPLLTRNSQVQALSPVEAARSYPVHIKGVVTYVDVRSGMLHVQDASAGIFVFVGESHSDIPLRAGQFVDLAGVSRAGDFSPTIAHATIHVLGMRPWPKPTTVPFNYLLAGTEDAQWIEAEGVVRAGHRARHLLFLTVAAPAGKFQAITPDFDANWKEELVNARVKLHGALSANFNEQHQSVAFRVFVPRRDCIHIDSPSPRDMFEGPVISALAIGQYHPQWESDRRVHVRGTLLATEPGQGLYFSDGKGSLEIEESPDCAAHPGDLVNVIGFPASIAGRPGLEDAACLVEGRGPLPAGLPATAEQLIPARSYAEDSGGVAPAENFDMKMLAVEGHILQIIHAPDGETLEMVADNRNFVAKLPLFTRADPEVKPDSTVRVTGLCVLTYDHYRRVQFFRLLVPDRAGIVVLEQPRWWNRRVALACVCMMVLLFLAALAWAWLLRTQVSRQTAELQTALASLTRLSHSDPLTGVANRRLFDDTLLKELARARRSGDYVSLLMVDIDCFKSINDRFGHLQGDECLIQVARALASVPRRVTDLVARFGGEEFGVILLTEDGNTLSVADAMRQRVEDLAIPSPASPHRVVTVSIGISTAAPRAGEISAKDVIAAADRGLYEAKSKGKNQVRAVSLAITGDPKRGIGEPCVLA
jgi:diguanylate cyclase (GGDEF)-like protein